MKLIAHKNYIIFNALLVTLAVINLIVIKSPYLGATSIVLFLFLSSKIFGRIFSKHQNLLGLITAICLIIITTSLFYFSYKLNTSTLSLTLILIFLTQIFIKTPTNNLNPATNKFTQLDPTNLEFRSANKETTPVKLNKSFFLYLRNLAGLTIKNALERKHILIILIYIFTIASFHLLFKSSTTESIVSPWQAVPISILILFFLTSLFTIIALHNRCNHGFLVAPLFLLSTSVALVVYKLGYGFDVFVHEATLRYINDYGAITPKTPYYIGMYGLELFFSKFSGASLETINKLLLPVFFGLILPPLTLNFIKNNKSAATAMLLLPLGAFIATTPQGLANLFLILLIFVSWIYAEEKHGNILLILLTISTFFIHALAGIPALIFSAIILLKNKTGKILYPALGVAALIIPATFFILSKLNPSLVGFGLNQNSFTELFKNLFDLKTRYNFWLDLLYFAGLLGKILLGAFVLSAIYKLAREKTLKIALPYLALFLISLFNFALIYKLFSFPLLVFYEQGDFALRFYQISFYFLIPLILLGGEKLWGALALQKSLPRLISFALLAFLITSSIYLSYPRKDAYSVSHGFSTSAHDIKTVQEIEEDAVGKSYVVLANQALGAAALREFGFLKPYLKTSRGEVYFYSIPTGGELYKYYLRMVYESPRASIAKEAAKLAGVENVYLVINDYWWNAKKLIEVAKKEASSWQEIDNGKAYFVKFSN